MSHKLIRLCLLYMFCVAHVFMFVAQLIAPDSLKLLPLYISGLLKHVCGNVMFARVSHQCVYNEFCAHATSRMLSLALSS